MQRFNQHDMCFISFSAGTILGEFIKHFHYSKKKKFLMASYRCNATWFSSFFSKCSDIINKSTKKKIAKQIRTVHLKNNFD